MSYYPKIEWEDKATSEEKLRAIYNLINSLLFEMYQGRVKTNKEEITSNIHKVKEDLDLPISIAFVKMAEKGDIDEITASEYSEMFLPWGTNTSYVMGNLRKYSTERKIKNVNDEEVVVSENLLYKCLQAHTSQEDWTPDVSPSLWKCLSITDGGIAEWSQPISSADTYMIGDEVMYNGVHYRSVIDNNVWSPADYPQGWECVE